MPEETTPAEETTMEEMPEVTSPNLGISGEVIEEAVDILQKLLSDEYMLYTKLRKYHWNVTGPQFRALHEHFEEQYTDLEVKIDEVAERIRTYGILSPGTLAEFKEHARLEEHPGVNPDATTMVQHIAEDHETMVRNLREDIDKADDLDEDGLEDFLTAYMQDHQTMAWLIRSYLPGGTV
jgi:starvation-inducible DNA-binding protein